MAGVAPTFKIKSWEAVGVWGWDLQQEHCGFCKESLLDPCITCLHAAQNGLGSSTQCQTVTGVCGHTFHTHCFAEWRKTKHTCPTCVAPWKDAPSK